MKVRRHKLTPLSQPEVQEAVLDAFRKTSRDILSGPIMVQMPEGTLMMGLGPWQRMVKRGVDLVGSFFLVLLLSPLFLVVAGLIKLTSPGPVLFRQLRPGYLERDFLMLKFRTMVTDAETRLRADPDLYRIYLDSDCKLPADIDPRFTRVGTFLRKTSLDELPQLFNVMRGHMGLVGPRPVLPEQIHEYGECIAGYYALRPGITGAWQVGGRSSVAFPLRAYLDLENLRDWSLLKDIGILLRTIPSVLDRTGAF
jgi:exopolysaccharide production protein ExoY